MAEPIRTSPLAGLAARDRIVTGAEPVTLSALPFAGKLLVRGGVEVSGRAAQILGCELPGTLRSAEGGVIRALWLGPDEWLLLVAQDAVDGTAAALREGLAGLNHALVVVSDRFTGMSIAGARAADVLNAGCPLDLHPRAFPAGMATRTLLGKAPVVLHRLARADAFELYVNGSFAPYAWLFLENAAREFRFAVAA